tara:strand:+ start:314 stop:556 length:243 start_codon:yes stop_codon:yes gene_type:complete
MSDFKKEYRKLVGKVIAARKRCGRSQIGVCKEAGISQAGWWEVEAGVHLPKIENLAAIAAVLGFQVELSLAKIAEKKDPA